MGTLASIKRTFRPAILNIRQPRVEVCLNQKWHPGSFISIKKGDFFRVTTFPGSHTTIYKAVEDVEVKSTQNGPEYTIDCVLV